MSTESPEVFVGRDKELQQFFNFLENKNTLALIIIAETGMGKSSFLKEAEKRIKKESTSTNRFVGFKEVLDGTTNAASPFIGVIDDLVNNLQLPLQEKISQGKKRALSTFKKLLSRKGKQFAKSIAKTIALKWLNKEQMEELEKAFTEFREEFENTQRIESLAEEIFSKHRDEFVQDLIFFFETLTGEYETLDFVFVVDQFERAPLNSYYILLGLIRAKIERLHIVVSFKMQKEGMENYDRIEPELHQLGTQFLTLEPLSYRTIGEWILKARGKEFSHPQLRRIRWFSGGFPFLIARWLMESENLEISELKVGREGYCRFIEWCFSGLNKEYLLFLRKISVLSQPLSVSDYERLTGTKTGECGILLEDLEKKRILVRQKDSFWFRHDLIKPCVERKLSLGEKRLYHMDAAKFFEANTDHQKKEFRLILCCAYHFHGAGEYEKSVYYNEKAADHSFDIGDLDVAEACYLRIIEAAQKLGKMNEVALAKAKMARIYRVWGRLDEAYRTQKESCEYFHQRKKWSDESGALGELGLIEQDRGNLDEAESLYNQSLKISEELHDISCIAASKGQLGIIERDRGELGKAEKLLKQCLGIQKALGDKLGIAKSLQRLGIVLIRGKRLEEALEHFAKAAYLFSLVDINKENECIELLVDIAGELGEKRIQKVLERLSEGEREYIERTRSDLKAIDQLLSKLKEISREK